MDIKLEDHMTWPRVGSTWNHYNGNNYRVLDFINIETERQDEYPTTIVYQNTSNGRKYGRALMDWERSMVKVSD